MPNRKISELTAAGALTGAELVEAVQGGQNVKTTTQDIADLGGGGGGGGTWGSITGDLEDQLDLYGYLRATRTVTGTDDVDQTDDNSLIKFDSASPFDFTLDQLTINSKVSFVNYGAGEITFIPGSGVSITGNQVLPAVSGDSFPTALALWDTATAVRIIQGSSGGGGGGGGGTLTAVSGTANRITSSGGDTPQIDISANYDALWAAAIVAAVAPYKLDSVSASTSSGTITLDMNSQAQRIFVGSASFAGPKTVALSNTTNSLVFSVFLNLSNLAAVLTFPSSFTMQSGEGRWSDGAHTFTATATGVHEFSAVFNGTDWCMLVNITPFS